VVVGFVGSTVIGGTVGVTGTGVTEIGGTGSVGGLV